MTYDFETWIKPSAVDTVFLVLSVSFSTLIKSAEKSMNCMASPWGAIRALADELGSQAIAPALKFAPFWATTTLLLSVLMILIELSPRVKP